MKALLGITSLFMAVVTALTVSLCVSFENNKDFKNDVTHKLESSAVTENIADINKELSALELLISNCGSDIESCEKQIEQLEQSKIELEKAKNDINSDIDSINNEIDSINLQISSLNSSLSSLRTSYNSHIAAFNTYKTTVNNSINNLNTIFYSDYSCLNFANVTSAFFNKILFAKLTLTSDVIITCDVITIGSDSTSVFSTEEITISSGTIIYMFKDSAISNGYSFYSGSYSFTFNKALAVGARINYSYSSLSSSSFIYKEGSGVLAKMNFSNANVQCYYYG